MKIGLIYTTNAPSLVETVEREVRAQLGAGVEFYSLADPGILDDVRAAGRVTAGPAARLVGMYMRAVEAGCDALLNVCSSVGEVADSVQPLAGCIGVPIVRIDEEMCREAVRRGRRIGVMATLPTTLSPTKHTLLRAAREAGREVELTDCLVDGAFGLDAARFQRRMAEAAREIIDAVDVVVLAQGSMAEAEPQLTAAFGKPFLSSPRFGAQALKQALRRKGLI